MSQSRRWSVFDGVRRALWHALALGVLAVPAVAQTRIPLHSVESTGDQCLVTLLPEATQGDHPPRLIFQARNNSDQIALDASAPGATEIQFVADNRREPFRGFGLTAAKAAQQMPLWQKLQALQKRRHSFFITARYGADTWASARYGDLDPLALIRIVENNCGFSSASLTAKSPEELVAEEARLGLSADQTVRIRWVLTSLYGPRTTDPGFDARISARERTWLESYTQARGLPKSRYLSEASARALLAEDLPLQTGDPKSYVASYDIFADWYAGVTGDNSLCEIWTDAKEASGEPLYRAPRMRFAAYRGGDGNRMVVDLVAPVVFSESFPITGVVDGRRSFPLHVEGNQVWTAPDGTGSSDAFIRAIKSGYTMEIRGTGKRTRKALTLRFSAYGFTAAFQRMMARCARPQLVDWLR